MTVAGILGLGTYPIQKPIHGGQRRVAAFRRFYEAHGIAYAYACVYNAAHYRKSDVGPYDYELDPSESELPLSNAIGDLMAGHQAATDPITFEHFSKLIEELSPDAIQLEQPFMWPLAKRLRQGARKPLLIYSSHNIEAPLKETILLSRRAPPELRHKICSEIGAMEAEIAREADLIICVSRQERDFYFHHLNSTCEVIIVPNGVERPMCSSHDIAHDRSRPEGLPYLMTVSSSHDPTIDALCHYVVKGGIFCVPPAPSIAICGGIAGAIVNHPEYRRHLRSNERRVRFFFDISDAELAVIKQGCHGVFLPIRSAGGTNLKTAEALALGKWVVATSTALRGFEPFSGDEGVITADSPADFRRAMRQVLQDPPLDISDRSRAAREVLYWDRCLGDSQLMSFFAGR